MPAGACGPAALRFLPYKITELCGYNNLNRKLELPKALGDRLTTNEFHIEKLKVAYARDEPFPCHPRFQFLKPKTMSFRLFS